MMRSRAFKVLAVLGLLFAILIAAFIILNVKVIVVRGDSWIGITHGEGFAYYGWGIREEVIFLRCGSVGLVIQKISNHWWEFNLHVDISDVTITDEPLYERMKPKWPVTES